MAPSCFTGQQRRHSGSGESARRRNAPPDSPGTTRMHGAGFIRTYSSSRPGRPPDVRDLRHATTPHCAGDAIDAAAAAASAMRTRIVEGRNWACQRLIPVETILELGYELQEGSDHIRASLSACGVTPGSSQQDRWRGEAALLVLRVVRRRSWSRTLTDAR